MGTLEGGGRWGCERVGGWIGVERVGSRAGWVVLVGIELAGGWEELAMGRRGKPGKDQRGLVSYVALARYRRELAQMVIRDEISSAVEDRKM